MLHLIAHWLLRLAAALAFYTCVPVPSACPLDFQGVARLAPLVGLLIGSFLAVADGGLSWLGLPVLTRSAVLVVLWLGLTGGFHLDGAIDTADGLAVADADRRLTVMRDSVTGAFGVMAAVAIVVLKVAALADLTQGRWLALLLVPGWGRWGQLLAIVQYPYLRPTGKGAFHKAAIQSRCEVFPTGLLLVLLASGGSFVHFTLTGQPSDPDLLLSGMLTGLALSIAGLLPAILTGAWFNQQLGGHTGDTYGAVVEWTEAFSLILVTLILETAVLSLA